MLILTCLGSVIGVFEEVDSTEKSLGGPKDLPGVVTFLGLSSESMHTAHKSIDTEQNTAET